MLRHSDCACVAAIDYCVVCIEVFMHARDMLYTCTWHVIGNVVRLARASRAHAFRPHKTFTCYAPAHALGKHKAGQALALSIASIRHDTPSPSSWLLHRQPLPSGRSLPDMSTTAAIYGTASRMPGQRHVNDLLRLSAYQPFGVRVARKGHEQAKRSPRRRILLNV